MPFTVQLLTDNWALLLCNHVIAPLLHGQQPSLHGLSKDLYQQTVCLQVDDKSQLDTQAGDGGGSDDDQEMPPPADGDQQQGPPEAQPADMPDQVPDDLQKNTAKSSSSVFGALAADCSWESFRSSLLTCPSPKVAYSFICKPWQPPLQSSLSGHIAGGRGSGAARSHDLLRQRLAIQSRTHCSQRMH